MLNIIINAFLTLVIAKLIFIDILKPNQTIYT